MKKFFAYLLALCMVLGMLPATALAAEAEPTYVTSIGSAADLKAFAESVNSGTDYTGKTVTLTAAITLTDEWTPIGNGTRSSKTYTGNAFKGTFDGGNFTISGLTITSTTGADAALGLFGVVDGGTVKNLKLTDVKIDVNTSKLLGGAIGLMVNGATADNITVSGAITGYDGVGGIVGRMVISGTISNCTNNASVTSPYGGIGGIVGKAYYEDSANTALFASITGCTNNGTVTAPIYVGGIAGLARANVATCVNNGAVTGNNQTGGIVGQLMAAGTVSGNENKGEISGVTHAGGIIGDYSFDGANYTYNYVTIANNTNRGEVTATEQCAAIMGCNNIDGNANMTASGNVSYYYVDGLELFGNPEDMVIDETNKFLEEPVAFIDTDEDGVQDEGETGYTTLAEAITAAQSGATIVLLDDIAVDLGANGGTAFTVAADDNIILDLNGFAITGPGNAVNKSCFLLKNDGTLIIRDTSERQTGRIQMTTSSAWSDWVQATPVANYGTLKLESGSIIADRGGSSTAMTYAIDTNGQSRNATTTITGGLVQSDYIALRAYGNSTTYNTKIVISDDNAKVTTTGDRSPLFLHLPTGSAIAQKAEVVVTGGTFTSLNAAPIRIWAAGSNIGTATATIEGGTWTYGAGYDIFFVTGDSSADFTKVFSITNGTFSTDPTAYLSDGKIAKKIGDTEYGVITNADLTSGTYMSEPSVAAGYTYTDSGGVYTVAPAVYTVALNTTEGTINSGNVTSYTYGVGATLPTDVTKTGYTFGGWYENAEFSGNAVTTISTDATGAKEYFAKWTINQYTITFDTNGGTAIDSITADYGAEIVAPANPTFVGSTFAGWDVEIPATMPAENVTITAQWTVNQYTITFVSNGSTYKTITQDYGTDVQAPTNPSRSGYTFKGWDTEIPATMPAENMTITAKWSKNYVAPTTTTEKTENEDGSTTTTVTNNKTGTTTSTTENVDGSTTVTETKKDGTSTSTTTGTTTETGEDGSTTKTDSTVTESVGKDGTTTKTEEKTETTEAADGSTTKTETKAETVTGTDGSVTATETKTETTQNADGTTSTATTETKTETKTEEDGSVVSTETKTETTENADGTTSTATTETKTTSATTTDETTGATVTETKVETKVESEEKTVTSTATETKTEAADGTTETVKVEETVEQTADTTTKTTATTTATAEKTETVAVKEETVTKADGTTETKTTTATTTELADGTTGTATTDESGKTEAAVTVSEQAAASEEPVVLPIPPVTSTTESEAASTVTVTTNSEETTKVEILVAEVNPATVAVIVNEDGTETVITETKMTEAGLVVDVPDGATVKIVDNSTDFHDVDDENWEKDAVDFASARGLVRGVGNNQFDLGGTANRAQVVTLLARLAGVDTEPDEGETWYDKAHEWAVANGITYKGSMNVAVSRQSLLAMMWLMNGAPESDHDIGHFTDLDGLTAFAEPAARWAVEVGLVQGYGDDTMNPTGPVTRGELTQFLMNFIQKT